MIEAKGYAAQAAAQELAPFAFERREVGARDVLIEILFCGVCHTDIHSVNDDWGGSLYPMVPGHEIIGRVAQVGANVTKFKEGDIAGVGCYVDSCRECCNCREGFEQFCAKGCAQTYNSTEMDRETPTFGGYSSRIVVDENYALTIAATENLAAVAPLLCAGITTYSPLKRFGVQAGQKVGIIGLGGLGHMGVKIAVSLGAEVTVFSTSPDKAEGAKQLGAHHFVISKNADEMKALASSFDFLLDTVSAPHDLTMYIELLGREGAMVLVGIPDKPTDLHAISLVVNNRTLAGSGIGGMAETQEMLDYCAANNITSDIELILIQRIAEAYERTVKSDVRYRFVIDMNSL